MMRSKPVDCLKAGLFFNFNCIVNIQSVIIEQSLYFFKITEKGALRS